MVGVTIAPTPLAMPIPAVSERHMLNRFSFGCTPELAAEAAAAGGPHAWFEQQLAPSSIPDGFAGGMVSWWPRLAMDAADLQAADAAGTLQGLEVSADLVRWTLMRRAFSKRQLLEVMAAFWLDHLHVRVHDFGSWAVRIEHDTLVRRHALGRFEDMLVGAVLGRALGCNLDNSKSTAKHLNENLGRELLELHTVGREAAYTERDVLDSPRILTGYRVDRFNTWDAWYAPTDHWVGPVQVLGFTHANSAPDGRPVANGLLRYLARHPATARRIAFKLCRRFVSDAPSDAVVAAVSQAYLASGTDIAATLRTLVRHPDFELAVGAKTRTPVEECIATWRALGLRPTKPTRSSDFALYCAYQVDAAGQSPFDWPRPDGPPDTGDAWSSVSRLLSAWNLHYRMAGSQLPTTGVTFRTPQSWLPPLPATVGEIIDHVSQQLLCRHATTRLTSVVAQRIDLPATTTIRVFDDLGTWRVARLLAAVLDTPEHMSR